MLDQDLDRCSQEVVVADLCEGFEVLLDSVEGLLSINAELRQEIRDLQKESKTACSGTQQTELESTHDNAASHDLLHRSFGRLPPYKRGPATDWGDPEELLDKVHRIEGVQGLWGPREPQIGKAIKAWHMLSLKTQGAGVECEKPRPSSDTTTAREDTGGRRRSKLATEQDFTTSGKQGDLGCPFAAAAELRKRQGMTSASNKQAQRHPNSLPTPPDLKEDLALDPIAADFRAADLSSPPPSVSGSMSKCPIRFIDRHSPEEVAKYFENHKHEIPRSHEVCVKRYQSNEASIRLLDAKYGNLVTMIQGLGMKHQPLLPTKEAGEEEEEVEEEEDAIIIDRRSIEKVEQWAENCNVLNTPRRNSDVATDARIGNFERPLDEVRVGESPSRPWGIRIPYREGLALSSSPSDQLAADAHQPDQTGVEAHPAISPPSAQLPQASGCPFGFGSTEAVLGNIGEAPKCSDKGDQVHDQSDGPAIDKRIGSDRPQLIFTGPVFIGYSLEQTTELMKAYK